MRATARLNQSVLAIAMAWAMACGGGGSGTDDGVRDVRDLADVSEVPTDAPLDSLSDVPEVSVDAPDALDALTEEVSGAECTKANVDAQCAATCKDLGPCQKCSCNTDANGGTCEVVDWPDETNCDDGDACTTGDKCAGGACVAGTSICECLKDADCALREDGDLCNGTLACDRVQFPFTCKVKVSTIVKCDTVGNTFCMTNQCAPATGVCSPMPAHTGEACAAANQCIVTAECKDGACTSTLDRDCDDGNPCVKATCDTTLGGVRVPNSDPCDDGNPCTVGDQCAGGVCRSGAPKACDDGLFCNGVESCDPTKAEGCVAGTPPACNDHSICTDDSCNETLKACVYARRADTLEGPRGSPTCSDGIDNDCDGLTDAADPKCSFGLGSVDPTTGPATGGTVVTLTGPYLSLATKVFVDEIDTAFALTAAGTIEVTMPPHAQGFVGFRVQADLISTSLPLAFRYVARSEDPNVTAALLGPLGLATMEEGDVSPAYQAEVTVPGVTDIAQPDPTAILGQFGFGLRGTNPWEDPSWRFTDAVGAATGLGSLEFTGSFTVAVGGYLDVAARFSLDGGATWVYADLDGTSNGYDPAQALKLTVQGVPKAGAVVINELLWMGSFQDDFDEWVELRNTTRAPYILTGWKLTNARYVPGQPAGDIVLNQSPQVVNHIVLEPYGYFLISQFEASKSQLDVDPDIAMQPASSSVKSMRLTNTPTVTYQLVGPEGTVVDSAKFTGRIGYHGDEINGKPVQSMERNLKPGTGLDDSDWHTAFVATGWKGDPRQTLNYGSPRGPNSDIPLCASDGDCAGVYPASGLAVCEINSCLQPQARCGIAKAADGESCTDGLFCTVGATCAAGSCAGGVPRDCADSGLTAPCTLDHCDETLKACIHEWDPAAVEGPAGSDLCNDGKDNDCDGKTDSADPGCNLLVVSVTPPQVPVTGGWEMTLTGASLGIVTGVSMGGVPAASFTRVNDGTLTFVAPAQPDVGDRDVSVTDGVISTYLAGAVRAIDLAPTVLANTRAWADPLLAVLGQASPPLSGQVFSDGYTNGTTPVDPGTIIAEIGVGPVDDLQSNPFRDWGWTWAVAQFNPLCADCTNVYEFTATVQPATIGTYLVAFRFSVDGGLHYQYGQLGSLAAAPWDPARAQEVTVMK